MGDYLNKKIRFLIMFTIALVLFGFLIESANKANIFTGLVTSDINFDNLQSFSTSLNEGDVFNILYNKISYNFNIIKINSNLITLSNNGASFDVNVRETKNLDLDKDSVADISIFVDNVIDNQVTLTVNRIICIPEWYCYSYGDCLNGNQNRKCDDLKKCPNPSYIPPMSRACLATCSDGVQNQDETGIDCGGSCSACKMSNNYIYIWAAIPIVLAMISIFIALFVIRLKKKNPKHKINAYQGNDKDSKDTYENIKFNNPEIVQSSSNATENKQEQKNEIVDNSSSMKSNNSDQKQEDFYSSIYDKSDINNHDKDSKKTNVLVETKSQTDNNSENALQNLRKYIQDCLDKNYSLTQIKDQLLKVGWKEDMIDQNIVYVKLRKNRN